MFVWLPSICCSNGGLIGIGHLGIGGGGGDSLRIYAALNIKQPLTWSEWLLRWRLNTNVDVLEINRLQFEKVFVFAFSNFLFNFSNKNPICIVNLPRNRFTDGRVLTNLSLISNSNRSVWNAWNINDWLYHFGWHCREKKQARTFLLSYFAF